MRAALALIAVIAMPAAAQETAMKHATGTFDVKITPEAQAPAPAAGMPTARMALAKTFSGGLIGTATGTMLSAGVPQPGHAAAYVAIDQVAGTLDGRKGGFLLLHQATMSSAGPAMTVTIAPDTGTAELTGIAGTLTIMVEGSVHHYDLAYTLPGAK